MLTVNTSQDLGKKKWCGVRLKRRLTEIILRKDLRTRILNEIQSQDALKILLIAQHLQYLPKLGEGCLYRVSGVGVREMLNKGSCYDEN